MAFRMQKKRRQSGVFDVDPHPPTSLGTDRKNAPLADVSNRSLAPQLPISSFGTLISSFAEVCLAPL
jgi:hypothetical protein